MKCSASRCIFFCSLAVKTVFFRITVKYSRIYLNIISLTMIFAASLNVLQFGEGVRKQQPERHFVK